MKTLQLVPAMEQGGVERGVVEVNRVLVGEGWENVVVSVGGRLADEIVRDGGRHVEADVKSKNPLTFFRRASRLRDILSAERPDVVCAHSRVPAWLFRRAARGMGIPWITFAHGANSISPYSRVMTYGDLVVTPSRYIAEYLKSAYGTPDSVMRVIPRAIDRARFDTDRLDLAFMEAKRAEWGIGGRYVVMAVGRITQLKGYDVLARAVAMLKGRGFRSPDGRAPRLVFVGEAEELRKDVEASLKALVAEQGLSDDVVFAGNQQKVAECLSLADVVVSSNVRKPEAFGRSMAEALAMGRPVVARAFGGALDVVRDGTDGVLVHGDDGADWPALFADALERCAGLEFGDLRADALERFSFEKMAASTLAVYREAAAMAGGCK
jgi:glycosyltransferase involved in cell wall biosynthesis